MNNFSSTIEVILFNTGSFNLKTDPFRDVRFIASGF